ncbi:hypothetical protein ACFWIQ_19230 [Kitasatospora sp. NPDC127059]|uniref:hypothetical protein n=1 Tax=unclassified Kitasatospora TaxID=2633591 RepID=UPI00364CED05
MRNQPRRLLAAAAAAALVSGAALASAPAALAAPTSGPTSGPTAPAPQGQASPVVVTTSGFPASVTAGSTVEFSSTLKNTADHQMDVMTDFVIATIGTGVKETQLKLQVQKPGSTQWQDAKLRPGSNTGAWWELDPFATELHLPAGGSATYQLRLTFAADAPGGQATGSLNAMVTDPTLPPEQRLSQAWGRTPYFTIVGAGGPTTPARAGLPDVKVENVPASFTAGGEAKPFKVVYTNHTGKDLRIVPAVILQNENAFLPAVVKLEFQTQQGQWLAGTPAPLGDLASTQLGVDLRSGSKDADVIPLPDGASRTVNLRLAWTKDAPVGGGSVFANGYSLPGPGEQDNGVSSPTVGFRVEAAAGSTGTPAPTSPATTPVTTDPATTDPSTAAAVPAAQVTTGAPSPAAGTTGQTGDAAPAAAAPPAATETQLASTGGGSSAAPMAITGATAIALGIGTLVVARRRKGAQGAGN